MALSPGARLGSYEIASALGAGGMGEVYRARDLRLGRSVAIKMLLPVVARDPERLSRFEREARALASLNHPNIAQLFDVDDGPHGAFLVMELVEGPTLAERIAAGSIGLDDALRLAAQIAAAVEAAHEQGIVHRDLKPSNVKVRVDGVVKVLDFGLAKVVDPVTDPGVLANSPTISSPAMTNIGVVLGTAAYMSPEQARGLAVDRRADIWAFGCVLYETLTGHLAFGGATVTDIIVAILEREPDWSRLPGATPPDIRRLLRRCLTKETKERMHDMADVRLAIEDARAAMNQAPEALATARRSPGWIGWSLAALAAAMAAAFVTWSVARRAAPALSGTLSSDALMEPLTFDSGVTRMPTLSSDGRLLAYASDRAGRGDLDVWIQQMAGGNPLRLTDDPADDSAPDFSSDGSQVTFRSERNGGGVYLVSALGGPARLIAAEGRDPRFSPDGSRIAYWTGQFRGRDIAGHVSSVFVVALTGGVPTHLLEDFDVAVNPVWATDGRSLVVGGRRKDASKTTSASFDWWVVPINGGAPIKTGLFDTALLQGAQAVAPERATPDGVLFSFRDDLWAATLSSAGGLELPPRRLTLGVGPYVDPTGGLNGEIVFARIVAQRVIERASLTNTAEPPLRLYADSGATTWRVSAPPDAPTIVFEREVGASREIWIKNTESGQQELVVRVPTRAPVNATISPDGKRIAYTQDSETGSSAGTGYVVEASGGVPRHICDRCAAYGFLADGRRLLVVDADQHKIRLIDSTTGSGRDLVVSSEGGRLDRPHASPDNRVLAFRQITGTVGKSYLVRLPSDRAIVANTATEIAEPTTTGRPAGWSLDSRVLYLLLDADGFRCIWAQRADPVTGAPIGAPTPARHFHSTIGMSTSYGNPVTERGFLFEAANVTSNLWRLRTSPRR